MTEWGPLAALIGDWEGDGGLDRAYSNSLDRIVETPYREKLTMKPFGPVDNGRQSLYGLDYKTAMWRGSEDNPFHTEVGYWLWDAATGEVLRGFVVPRGITVLAGGIAAADATTWTMHAEVGHQQYAIGENTYLAAKASSRTYDVSITVNPDGTWSYDETTILHLARFPGEDFRHTDHNTMHRVG